MIQNSSGGQETIKNDIMRKLEGAEWKNENAVKTEKEVSISNTLREEPTFLMHDGKVLYSTTSW